MAVSSAICKISFTADAPHKPPSTGSIRVAARRR
jgi:hypothetical protein